jgi:hypothetical protein
MQALDKEIADGLGHGLPSLAGGSNREVRRNYWPAISFNVASVSAVPSRRDDGTVSKRIEDYALIGDRRSAALVARDGAIDWLCWPNFDSDACFAALLGDERHGRWQIAPRDTPHRTFRRYLGDTLILETRHETATGTVCITDLMPIGTKHRAVIRKVVGEAGAMEMTFDLALRFDYGSIPPWLRVEPRTVCGIIGPDLVVLRSPIDITRAVERVVAEFTIGAGNSLTFTLQYGRSHEPEPPTFDAAAVIGATEEYWQSMTRGSPAQSLRSNASWSRIGLSAAGPEQRDRPKAPFLPAPAGSPIVWGCKDAPRRHAHISSAC